jgi:DNA mismatch repair protein MutS2
MSFRCQTATLERLEWPRLLECLAALAATERGGAACRAERFAPDLVAVRERLAETSEARALLDAGESLPFGGVSDLRPVLAELQRGRAVGAGDLAAVRDAARGARLMRAFLSTRGETAPRLADLANTLADLRPLEQELGAKLTPDGELRDDASPALGAARREIRRIEADIERRMSGYLRDPQIAPHLQDNFATFRENRPVLPVRADARRQVRGILHDVSSSGTTVFIEPEEVVELGNRLRLARTQLEREIERILRQLGLQVAARAEDLLAQGDTLELLDVASACGRLSRQLGAAAPEVDPDAPLQLVALRHPLLLAEGDVPPEDVVPNDVALPAQTRGLVISGPNAGGKTVLAKALGLAVLCVRSGLHVPCEPGSRMPQFDALHADIGDEQDLRAGLSTFSARMRNVARILDEADRQTLVIVDEVGEGTEPGEGAALAQATLEALVERGAFVVATTHFNRLKELAGSDPRFTNASAEFDRNTLRPTYRVHMGVPGSSGATWVAERMGVEPAVVERARALLDREDRRLEALTRSLSELRQELEGERQLAAHMREQTESVRAEYETRLHSLREAREQALASMKAELEAAYRSARDEIAGVVRSLQRGAGRDSGSEPGREGRDANRAQQRLAKIRARTEQVEERHAPEPAPRPEIEWEGVEPGALLELEGVKGAAILVEPPDRRGRLTVRVGGARMAITTERVHNVRASRPAQPPAASFTHVARASDEGTSECDLRGLRVDEALDRAQAHVDRLLGTGSPSVRFIHGHGTGALRSAVRSWLRDAPGVAEFRPGQDGEGGNGVTVATLDH